MLLERPPPTHLRCPGCGVQLERERKPGVYRCGGCGSGFWLPSMKSE